MATESSLYGHFQTVFNHMQENGQMEELDGINTLVYTGFLSRDMREMEMPSPYYSYITRALEKSGMAVQIRRGAGKTPSRWAISNEIAPRAQIEAILTEIKGKPREGRVVQLEQRERAMDDRVRHLEKMMDIMIEAVEDLQRRLEASDGTV